MLQKAGTVLTASSTKWRAQLFSVSFSVPSLLKCRFSSFAMLRAEHFVLENKGLLDAKNCPPDGNGNHRASPAFIWGKKRASPAVSNLFDTSDGFMRQVQRPGPLQLVVARFPEDSETRLFCISFSVRAGFRLALRIGLFRAEELNLYTV